MTKKNLRVSPYISIYGIILLYVLIHGLLIAVTYKLESYGYKYAFGFFAILFFIIITYFINRSYFKRINLKPPRLVGINKALFTGIIIGILFAVIIAFPYRIYAVIKSGIFEYIFMAFTIENFFRALGAGITEEIIARGTLLNFYKQQDKKYLGLVISSIIFGLMHLTNAIVGYEITLLYIVRLVITGFCFGLIYLNFGIVAVIAAHLFYNLIVTSFIQPTRYGFYYTLGINIILCIWLFVRDRKKQIIE